MFDKVQEIRKHRAEKIKPRLKKNPQAFKGMIKCGICGKAYTHKTTPHNEIWKCSLSVTKGIEACPSKQVPDSKIKKAANTILKTRLFDEIYFKSKVKQVIVMPNRKLIFQLIDDTRVEQSWNTSSRSESWTPEMREKARIRALKQHKGGVHHG